MNKIQLTSLIKTGKDLHLLYVEDNEHTRKEISEQLSIFFPHVMVACDGAEGLEKFKNSDGSIDLVISDIKMPKMDGLEMVRQIRELDSRVKVLIFSAYDSSEYLRKSLNLSVDGYLMKPLDHQQFLSEIAKVTGYIKLEKENASYQAELEQKVEEQVKTIQEAYRRLETAHYQDTLTGLPNRFALQRDFSEVEGNLLLLDIKNFKALNQIYGNEIGNEVLQTIATSLEKLTEGRGYFLYKMQIDIYAIVSTGDQEAFVQWNETCVKQLEKEPYLFADAAIEISIEMSCGMSRVGNYSQAIGEANIALQYAKEQRICQAVYKESFEQGTRQHFDIEIYKTIKEAVSRGDIIPAYQAIVDHNGDMVAYEALTCLRDGDDLLSASQFMETARYSKHYHTISRSIIKKSFENFKNSSVSVTINIGVIDIMNEKTLATLLDGVRNFPDPSRIIFEILETETIENRVEVLTFVTTVRAYGAKIAIDDFGSGYSNFSALLQIRPDKIKIDGELIRYIDKDTQSYEIVKSIVDFAHKLGIECVGEYIASESIYQKARSIGMDYYQGYHIHKPSLEAT